MDATLLMRLMVFLLVTISNGLCLILRLPCLDHADFTIFEVDKVLNGSILMKFSGVTDIQCMTECVQHQLCKSYNIQLETKECEINSKTIGEEGALIQSKSGWVFKTTDYNKTEVGEICEELHPCQPGILCKDSCEPPYYECIQCDNNHHELHCDKLKVSSRNIARGKETSQSSTRDRGGASGRAVDGNKDVDFRGASCTHTNSEDKPWWSVDLGKPYLVHSLNITNRGGVDLPDRLLNFDVTVDNRLCRHHSGVVGSGATILLSCDSPIVGRIVKIQLRAKECLTLCEVEVYEALLTDAYDCSKNPCQNGGICTPTEDAYQCTCLTGYSGKNCEIDNNECSSLPCFNGGTCIDGVNSFTCQCIPGYTGVHCETDVNECESNPCQNGGTCTDKVNHYVCGCAAGYYGKHCEADLEQLCGVKMEALGCFNKKDNDLLLPILLDSHRDPNNGHVGFTINWDNFPQSLQDILCHCAQKSKERGYKYFGLSYYAECWAGPGEIEYNKHGVSDGCVNTKYKKCPFSKYVMCSGTEGNNFFYKL